ncbi:protein kinase [Streptomyces sp. Y1]|uniref:Protein kinase n=1 Tax=Streptomyces sp. Y1 TaxID=3238634 RepID=A0AB39TR18_9ACTN
MDPLRPTDPTTIGGRYRLLARLGRGGMGVVYLGRSPGGRLVAVKCVHWDLATDPLFRRRFTQELEAVRRVGGFHTAQVVDADPDGDPPWLVTAYIPGPSLDQAVSTHGPLPEPVLRVLGAGLAEALEAIHAAGLVHRDLKPSNVLLGDDGPRVIDFGIARALDGASITRTQTVIGTPAYMAPEQIAGEPISPACDLFSLGRVLCHAAGSDPFGGSGEGSGGNAQVLLYRMLHTEPDLGGVPDALRPVVAACLARRPQDRPTPAEVIARLGAPAYDGPTGSWLPAGLRGGPAVPDAQPPAVPETPRQTALLPVPPPLLGPVPATPSGPIRPVEAGGGRRRSRWLWVLVPSVLALVAAAVLVPGYLRHGAQDSSGLSNDGFVTATSGGPPDCVTGGPAGTSGSVDSTLGPPPAVPADTPHPPALSSPADQDILTTGGSLVLRWTKTGAVTKVFTSRFGDTRWQASGWLTTADCTFRPTGTGVYQWAVASANIASASTVSSGWSTVRYLNVVASGSSIYGNPIKGTPAAPEQVAPDDRKEVRVGQPVELSWTTPGPTSSVNILLPDARDWQRMPWKRDRSYTFTPPIAGVYQWVVYAQGTGDCGKTSCLSAPSEQRYLIAR